MSALHLIPGGPRLCQNDGQSRLREQALEEVDRHLDNLRSCIHWLVAMGIAVVAVDMRRGSVRPVVNVAASDWVRHVFVDDCASSRQTRDGITYHHWTAIRHGCAIHWTEMQPMERRS